MVQPFLFVGVGGSGGKTLRAIKQELRNILRNNDWDFDQFGFPVMWQFVHIDTPYQQDGEDFPARPLDAAEYLGLVAAGTPLDGIIANLSGAGFERAQLEEIMAALPKEGQYDRAVDEGAGQYRGIGREVAIARLEQIKSRIRVAFQAMSGPEKARQRTALDNIFKSPQSASGEVKPKILLISSLAGGSGSGQFLDVSEAIKAAAPNDAWIHDQTAILFAPDVFEDPKITINEGIAPNSLFATGELVSGKWRRKNTEIQETLYTKFQFAKVDSAEYNVGPKRVVLVGRSNGQIEFSSQNDVYMAAALSIAKWTTDTGVAEALGTYLGTNYQGTSEPAKLKVSGLLTYPMNSIGFARVSLGMDYFADYSAGRLARQAVQTLVFGHKSNDKTETDTSAISRKVDLLINDFSVKLGIGGDGIRKAICPPAMRSSWLSNFSIEMDKHVGAKNQQQSSVNWIQKITAGLSAVLPSARGIWISQRQTETWVKQVQQDINKLVALYAADHGLLVAHGLLRKVIAARGAQLTTKFDKPDLAKAISEATMDLTNQLASRNAGTMLGTDPDVVKTYSTALERAENFMRVEDEAFIRGLVSDLLVNYLTPLAEELEAQHRLMLSYVEDTDYKRTGSNKFKSWPVAGVTPPPPAPNMRLLMHHTEFEDMFDRLLGQSLQVPAAQALPEAVREMVGGSRAVTELQNLDPDDIENNGNKTWQPFIKVRPWNPAGNSKGQARWSGSFVSDLDDWEDIAEKYVRIKGRPLGEEISTTLYAWLNDTNPSVRARNEERLKGEFNSVLSMSKPFAKVNSILNSLAHGGGGVHYEMVFSDIPVDLNGSSSLGQELQDALVQANVWNDKVKSAFKGELSRSSTIDVFSTLKNPVHHFIFDNLMNPIIERWGKVKGNTEERAQFMKFRQGRPLPETIPLAPEILEQALRGWYVGQLLNRITKENGAIGQGVKLLVHFDPTYHEGSNQNASRGYKAFPYPLLYPRDRVPAHDYAPVVLSSIAIALADCSNANSLEPLMPYHELMYLGGPVSETVESKELHVEISPLLEAWILDGNVGVEAPMPDPARAGTADSSPDVRRAKAIAYFQECLAEVDKFVNFTDPIKRHDSLVWQMRREINRSLNTLIKFCEEVSE